MTEELQLWDGPFAGRWITVDTDWREGVVEDVAVYKRSDTFAGRFAFLEWVSPFQSVLRGGPADGRYVERHQIGDLEDEIAAEGSVYRRCVDGHFSWVPDVPFHREELDHVADAVASGKT